MGRVVASVSLGSVIFKTLVPGKARIVVCNRSNGVVFTLFTIVPTTPSCMYQPIAGLDNVDSNSEVMHYGNRLSVLKSRHLIKNLQLLNLTLEIGFS